MDKDINNIVRYRRDPDVYFRVGLRYAEKHRFYDAKRFFEKAAKDEPFNADYQFNLACILSELKETRKSNKILKEIIREIDPTLAECYFGIACNYFELGNLKKAREYLEKYIQLDINGEFVDEAYDILYYLQLYDSEEGTSRQREKTVTRLANEGRKLLDEGLYNEACQKFEKAVEFEPCLVGPRNDLAIACFLSGNIDRAVSLASSVIKLDPNNLLANSSLALFYARGKYIEQYKKQLEILAGLVIQDEGQFLYDLKKFLKVIMKDVNTDYNLKTSIIEVIERRIKEFSNNRHDGNLTEEEPMNSCRFAPVWKDEWGAVIECAENYREPVYKSSYINDLKKIWINFINRLSPGEIPRIAKVEVWAAVLEYVYCCRNLIRVSIKKLAEKYNVSVSSISSKLKYFKL
ncbi:MAG TPA: tetratricopeptide repeat protein [Clostridiaceae bacterium]|nr:tetratricopeptide repeat protein [Clostridiaceae bacterium]